MDDIIEKLETDIKEAMDYFSLYYEYLENGISEDFFEFALDEMKHAKFWLDMLEIKMPDKYDQYKEQFQELENLLHNGGDVCEY